MSEAEKAQIIADIISKHGHFLARATVEDCEKTISEPRQTMAELVYGGHRDRR